jgi:CHAD domain-containing protein
LAKPPRYDGVTREGSFCEAGRHVLRAAGAAAFVPLSAVLRGDDVRAVHDMRVGLRRLRSGIATFASCFPKERVRPLQASLKRNARRLGVVRDADVHLAALRSALGGAPMAERPGITYAIEELTVRRRRALARLAIELSQFDRRAFETLLADG